ncbi:MAG: endonuclease V, partial [Stackebrandtia sp.]
MDIPEPRWPEDVAEAEAIQRELRDRVRDTDRLVAPSVAVGVDVGYDPDSPDLVAAAVAVDIASGTILESVTETGHARFGYLPGLLAFRELPIVLRVLRRLTVPVELVVCDGHGLAHPRRFGLACHLGVLIDRPVIGVAKNPPPFPHEAPGPARGDHRVITDADGLVGIALRTQDKVKPVYVSIGHAIGLGEARDLVLRLAPKYRQPETTRAADQLGRRVLAGIRRGRLQWRHGRPRSRQTTTH